jgi:hypothetical protein
VQNVSVGDGGKAIVGNVAQHANVIVSDSRGDGGATLLAMPQGRVWFTSRNGHAWATSASPKSANSGSCHHYSSIDGS